MIEIPFFQGIALIVLASLTAVGWSLKIARNCEREAEIIVNEKASMLDEYFLKSVSVVSTLMSYRLFKILGQTQKISETIKFKMGEYIDELLKLKPEQIEEEIDSAEIPPEFINLCRLRDEDKDRLFNISFLAFQLKESVPEVLSSMVDRMTKGVIFGIVCGLSIGSLDFFISFNLMQYFSVVVTVILITGFFYFYYGILGMWTLRKLEKKLKELKKARELEDIWQTVTEISEYG